MADITISDLELAPALTDDMVLPVENTTDTYAATLAMLRRLLNKTFVEVENADFNALTDDGFYQCTGTPTNSPVAGAINWTLQVSAENGVVVQRAFSLDDNFANIYIRRWNGVTWTGWLDVGKGALDNKADIDASNFNTVGKRLLSGLGAFSSNSVVTSLALGAVGTVYTAPSTGYVRLRATDGSHLGILVSGIGDYQSIPLNATLHFWSVLLKKGTQYSIEYNGTLTNHNFISADGEN